MPDVLTPDQRRRAMQANKSRNTSIELALRRELFKRGRRYRAHVAQLPGRPDIVFGRHRVAIFVDGDFWHGYRLPSWEHKLSDFWKEKIMRNRARDKRNHRKLRNIGWTVVRVWEHEIREDVGEVANRIEALLEG